VQAQQAQTDASARSIVFMAASCAAVSGARNVRAMRRCVKRPPVPALRRAHAGGGYAAQVDREELELTLLHQDDDLIVVDKPAGLLAVPGRGEAGRDNLASRAQRRWPDARIVHRLDMATSGLMLFARGDAVQRKLGAAFEGRRVHKRYEAWVAGVLQDDEGCIDAPLAADWPRRPRQQVDPEHGRPARTRWRVLGRDAAARRTRLELEPITGRTHQLRVHLLAIGHPILGDTLYAPEAAAPRLLLHACALALAHPRDGRECEFTSAAPF
jgi:tRNA pseudouridine32 synthase/23S rRNA pseudouridine746 synthase